MKNACLLVCLFACSLVAQDAAPRKTELACSQAALGFKASMAGFHLTRCLGMTDGKISLIAIDLKRVMANGDLYPGSAVRHLEFPDLDSYRADVCADSDKHDPDHLWKPAECKWTKEH